MFDRNFLWRLGVKLNITKLISKLLRQTWNFHINIIRLTRVEHSGAVGHFSRLLSDWRRCFFISNSSYIAELWQTFSSLHSRLAEEQQSTASVRSCSTDICIGMRRELKKSFCCLYFFRINLNSKAMCWLGERKWKIEDLRNNLWIFQIYVNHCHRHGALDSARGDGNGFIDFAQLCEARLLSQHSHNISLACPSRRRDGREISSGRRVEELMKSINGDVMIIGLCPHDLADDIFNIIDNTFIKHTTFSYIEDILSISIKRRRIITLNWKICHRHRLCSLNWCSTWIASA